MRKIVVMALTFVLLFSFVGCSDKTLTYNTNLGYDLSEIDHESVEFNVYHSNTENHITITSEDNRVEKTENTESYYTEDIDTYEFTVDGFDGWIGSFKTFEVKDIDGEQFYRLYPISNDAGGIFFNDLKMDRPYDEDEENLDNILITIKIK